MTGIFLAVLFELAADGKAAWPARSGLWARPDIARPDRVSGTTAIVDIQSNVVLF